MATISEQIEAMDNAIREMLRADQKALRNAKTPEERDQLHKKIQSHKEVLAVGSDF